MTVSTKLGIASVAMAASVLVPPYSNWRGPIDFAAFSIAFSLGLLAAHRGSKWWLAIPSVIAAGFGICFWVAAHSY